MVTIVESALTADVDFGRECWRRLREETIVEGLDQCSDPWFMSAHLGQDEVYDCFTPPFFVGERTCGPFGFQLIDNVLMDAAHRQ